MRAPPCLVAGMRRVILAVGLLPFLVAAKVASGSVAELSLAQLEDRVEEIDRKLEQLASYSLRSGVGSVGFRSDIHDRAATKEWIQIDLEEAVAIDHVVLVPAIWRDTKTGFRADGFPLEFRIVAGTELGKDGMVVASFGREDGLLPRIAPLVVPCPGTVARWIRVEATVLSPRAWDGRFGLQLSEIFVFSGRENVALHRPVDTWTGDASEGGARNKRFLVDGSVPYLMNAARGEQSVAFVSGLDVDAPPTLTIDLGSNQPVDRLHLHAVDISDTIPQAEPADFAMPHHLVVEGAQQPDFSDAFELVDYKRESPYDTGPIVMLRFPETECRFVRLVALAPYERTDPTGKVPLIGFAEVEIFGRGRNLARGKPFAANFPLDRPRRGLTALTDGRNLYGDILPIRDWLIELAARHDLETERPIVRAELGLRYAQQKANLVRLGWLAGLLAVGIVVTALIARLLQMRQVARIRERLAADLHDELGANMHTIGLLSDLAQEARDAPEELDVLHRRIRSETERSGVAVRHCANMLGANGLYPNLVDDMHRAVRRIMARLDHEMRIEGEEHLSRLKPRTQFDLLLFYKECLVNISRHSDATEFMTDLWATERDLSLTVSDNGTGLADLPEYQIPPSLQRRARLLGARVRAGKSPDGGTQIELNLRTRKWGVRK